MKELHIALGTVKLNEGDILSHTDDLDGYVALATYQWNKDNMVGVNYTWTHSDGNCPSSNIDATYRIIGRPTLKISISIMSGSMPKA